MSLQPVRWWEAHPLRLKTELEAMETLAPELVWTEALQDSTGAGWTGVCPVWPFRRPQPMQLDAFLQDRRFEIEVRCSQAHPVVAPTVYPLDPKPDIRVRTRQQWHVLGDGGLCLLRETLDWTGAELAAELVRKAAGWFLEFLLLRDGSVEAMTNDGIVEDPRLDHLLAPRSEAQIE